MTAAQLIAELQKLHPDTIVCARQVGTEGADWARAQRLETMARDDVDEDPGYPVAPAYVRLVA